MLICFKQAMKEKKVSKSLVGYTEGIQKKKTQDLHNEFKVKHGQKTWRFPVDIEQMSNKNGFDTVIVVSLRLAD